MSLATDLRLRPAVPADLDAAIGLRAAAGWSAHEWALRYVLSAPEARCVVVEDHVGAPIGMGSGVAYGSLGVVGNMVVAGEHRRRGIGMAILREVLDDLRGRGVRRVELYATADGRPLYERAGFHGIQPGSRVEVPRSTPLGPDAGIAVEQAASADELAAYDAPRFGGDRRSLLAWLIGEADRPMLVARRGDAIAGFAWLRPEDGRLGPFMADAPGVAASLLAAAFERLRDASVLTFNLPMSNADGRAWLQGLGVAPDPWDGRMALGPEVARRESATYGNVVGALG